MPRTHDRIALPVDESLPLPCFQEMRFVVGEPVIRMPPLIPHVAKSSEGNEHDRRNGEEEHQGEQHSRHPRPALRAGRPAAIIEVALQDVPCAQSH